MQRNVRRLCGGAVVAAILVAAGALHAQNERTRAAWNRPQKPFKVFGNTYWVGTYSLGSVLVTSDAGHVLIDAALPESVPQIRDHIRDLGFKVEDIKLILNTHDHYDHAGRDRRAPACERSSRRSKCAERRSAENGYAGGG